MPLKSKTLKRTEAIARMRSYNFLTSKAYRALGPAIATSDLLLAKAAWDQQRCVDIERLEELT